MAEQKEGSWRGRNRAYITAVVLAVMLTLFISPEVMEDTSMSPAVPRGAVMLVNKQSYSAKRGSPDIGQVVVMEKNYAPKVSEDNIVARVVGGPGDLIEIRSGKLYRNGRSVSTSGSGGSLGSDRKVKVDRNSVYLLCDNHNSSTDSRNPRLGPVKLKEIKGDAVMLVWPFSHFGGID